MTAAALSIEKDAPPRAPLAFRVGVVGHRPNRLQQADLGQLGGVLHAILGVVKEEVVAMQQRDPSLFDSAEPKCQAMSPLAEGTDRLFAEQAVELGFELCCVMPFHQAEFERDFAPGVALEDRSLERFRHLVGQAHTRFELDGTRAKEGAAYGAAGRSVLHQSDLLVVVWDGQRQNKRGGTEETLDEARRLGVPVVWVDAHAPHRWQILDAATQIARADDTARLSPAGVDGTEALRKRVRAAIELPKPQPPSSPHARKLMAADDPALGLRMYYAERQPRWTLAVVWKAFRDIVGDGKRPRVEFSVRPFEDAVKGEWPENRASAVAEVVDRLRPYYAWPDKLAVVYSDRYRSAFVLAFLLAAVAVGLALLPIGLRMQQHHLPETLAIALELLAILTILGLVLVGRWLRWHERWINYRLAAELVRHLRLVAPLGGGRPFPQIPAHWATYGQPASTWMAWYVRAVERALGLPTAVVDKTYLDSSLNHLHQLVEGQVSFHEASHKRSHQIEKRLHRFGIALLLLTLAACGLHLLPNLSHAMHVPDWLPPVLTFCCGFFPALGAAMAGILNQGEFRRIAMRSESMREQLLLLGEEIDAIRHRVNTAAEPAQEQFSVQAAELASDVTRLLLNEVLDWRVVFLDRPVVPPS